MANVVTQTAVRRSQSALFILTFQRRRESRDGEANAGIQLSFLQMLDILAVIKEENVIMTNQDKQCVWHAVPRHMRGSEIFSLSGLRKAHPELAQWEEKKYTGRESLMSEYVPPLDCLWNDIIFFSPYAPQIMLNAYKEAGFDAFPMRFYQVPIERLSGYNMVLWLPPTKPKEPNYKPFAPSDLPMEFPQEQRQAYKAAFEQGFKPLLYARSPHLCLAAPVIDGIPLSLNIDGLEIIEVS